MATEMTQAKDKAMAKNESDAELETDSLNSEDLAPRRPGPSASAGRGKSAGGFFTIYKRGQGKWTRLGTAIGIGLLSIFTGAFVYDQLRASVHVSPNVAVGVGAGLAIGLMLLGYWAMNKASNADFLIATDSEMKKVNWTSRKELIGSTKVVIFFMLLIAVFLFVIDTAFAFLFWLIGVLKANPFG